MEEKQIRKLIEEGRELIRTGYDETDYSDYQTDQELKKQQPPLVKEAMTDNTIDLPKNFDDLDADRDFFSVIDRRCSHRVFTHEKISLLQLSYL